jgi:hypothetical protein
MTLGELAAALESLDDAGWDRLAGLAVEGGVGADAWDAAWERAMDRGLAPAGIAFADRLRPNLQPAVRAAVAGAAAALSSDGRLDSLQSAALLRPVGAVTGPPPSTAMASRPTGRQGRSCALNSATLWQSGRLSRSSKVVSRVAKTRPIGSGSMPS